MNNISKPSPGLTQMERKQITPQTMADYIEQNFSNARTKWMDDNPNYVSITDKKTDASKLAIRALAFYLPQFHAIPENDAWWGKGFTEWTNVTRAVPVFTNHEQPRLPGELGFYDLNTPGVMERQVQLAKLYGLTGFCFHYYWFAGKRLLEMPLDKFLNTPELDFGFCINYANENWSRRWDGSEADVLIAQHHSDEDDKAMMQDACRYFRDPRYIRVDGKPVFLIYRIGLFPDAVATVERWREVCRAEGIGEIFVVAVRSFQMSDPIQYGVDASVEFPPHGPRWPLLTEDPIMNLKYKGKIFDYQYMMLENCKLQAEDFGHTVFRGLMPGWDNTARRPDGGDIYYGHSPELYKMWLTNLCDYTLDNNPPNQNLVFINAWNEWAEAAYLEPDRRNGYAYLQATADALNQFPIDD